MKRLIPVFFILLICVVGLSYGPGTLTADVAVATQGETLPTGFVQVRLAQGLDPTAMAITPDGRIFITEKNGRVLVLENGTLLPEPLAVVVVDNNNERGLSGIAIHPDFENNGYFYLYFTVKDAGHNRVSRFTSAGNHVVPGSELIMLDLSPLSGTIHNAGAMAFGPDSTLYISVGDGSSAASAQSTTSLLGKILRINDDGTIPKDNPFYSTFTDEHRAVYALGVRNSFSMAIQPGSGRIFATEVGASGWEEINEITAGMNYGWSIIEGPLAGQSPPDDYKEPTYAYNHSQGCAAVGAAFYNPQTQMFPAEFVGKFFFADYCGGYIKYLNPDTPDVVTTFATGIARPLNLLVADDGTMYYLARAGMGGGSEQDNTVSTNGSLWRVIYTGDGSPFVAVNPESQLIPVGESVTFVTTASGTQPLFYQWQRDQIDITGATSKSYELQDAMLSDSGSLFRCIVDNAHGIDTTSEALLRVTANQRPEPEILTPAEGSFYKAGDLIEFTGIAPDPEQGTLPAEALRWRIDFHHGTHTHPAMPPLEGADAGSYYIPQIGETADNVWYRIHLNATDAGGLSKNVTRTLLPLKTQIHVRTIPEGLPLYVGTAFVTPPVMIRSVVGLIRRLEAQGSVIMGDSILVFQEWIGGGTDPLLVFAAESDTITYTAVYKSYPLGNGTGLLGSYYNGPPYDPTFYEPAAFTRLDPKIDFNWGEGSPSMKALGDDFWLVRWEGFIEPIIDDAYTFSVFSDDGARLWVDNVLIVDEWHNQPPKEWFGEIQLNSGSYYPVRLEYFESGGGALCRLSWESTLLTKRVVPETQLYSVKPVSTIDPEETLSLMLYPNPASSHIAVWLSQEARTESYDIQNVLGQVVLREIADAGSTQDRFHIDVSGLPSGMYWLRCHLPDGHAIVAPFIRL
jgi:glucose/arabinose dehydrogenase